MDPFNIILGIVALGASFIAGAWYQARTEDQLFEEVLKVIRSDLEALERMRVAEEAATNDGSSS